MRYQRYQRSKSPVRMFLCKPDNRKWLIVTGGLLAVIITLSVILAVTLSGRASGASGVRDPANLRQAVDSIDGIPLFTAYIPEDSPGRPGVCLLYTSTISSIFLSFLQNTFFFCALRKYDMVFTMLLYACQAIYNVTLFSHY